MDQCGIWSRRINETPIAIIDFETTGLYPNRDRVVEVSVVRMEPGCQPILVLDTLVNPERKVQATEIHGITDEDVLDAPTFAEISHDFMNAVSGAVLAAYNVYFDIKFMTAELERGGNRRLAPHICLMYMRPLLGLGPRCSLEAACRSHGIDSNQSHTATSDTIACAALLNVYRTELARQRLSTFGDLARKSTYKFVESFDLDPIVRPLSEGTHSSSRFKSRSSHEVSQKSHTQQTTPADRSTGLRAYWDALIEVLADSQLSADELARMRGMRAMHLLTEDELRFLHGQVFGDALKTALSDGDVSESEANTLRVLSESLTRLGWAPGD